MTDKAEGQPINPGDEIKNSVLRLPLRTLKTLEAVSLVDGRSGNDHVAEAVASHLASIVLQPTFAGEFADACADHDAKQAELNPNYNPEESTHSLLAPYVIEFRQQARET